MSIETTIDQSLLDGKVKVLPCQHIVDERGTLVPVHFEPLGFQARRMALISAHDGEIRGAHAHREGAQLLMCVSGSVDVTLRHQGQQAQVTLEPGTQMLFVESPVWTRQAYRGDRPCLLMLSDVDYSPDLYMEEEAQTAMSADA